MECQRGNGQSQETFVKNGTMIVCLGSVVIGLWYYHRLTNKICETFTKIRIEIKQIRNCANIFTCPFT